MPCSLEEEGLKSGQLAFPRERRVSHLGKKGGRRGAMTGGKKQDSGGAQNQTTQCQGGRGNRDYVGEASSPSVRGGGGGTQ